MLKNMAQNYDSLHKVQNEILLLIVLLAIWLMVLCNWSMALNSAELAYVRY